MVAICKTLNVLPRSGGVLDQPNVEFVKLEAILTAFDKYQEWQDKKDSARRANRNRHRTNRTIEH